MTRARILIVLGLVTGCSTWQTTADLDQVPMPADSTATFDVWEKDGHRKLRALGIDADSIRGIPADRPLSCDSCRVSLPRTAVDSIRSTTTDPGETAIMGIVVVVLLFPVYFIMMMSD
jgi:hypothetical protein